MKNKFSKIINNKNIKIIIPVIVLLVLLIVVFIYLREYKYNQYRNKQEHSFYQYFAGQKIEYDAIVSFNKKNEIKSFVPKVLKINYESIPIYYQEEKKVIFPDEMSIIFPLKKKIEYKINEFSYIERVNDINYLFFEDYKNNIDHYIIFNGDNLYFFSDSVNLIINNEKITLSPMSYVVSKLNEFSYYDYEKDEYKRFETTNEIIVSNEYYSLNTTNDYIEYGDNQILLSNDINILNKLTKE